MALVAGLSSTSGCHAFRAQIGGGVGIGADVKLPGVAHVGLDAGRFMNIGPRYDSPELSHDAEVNAMAWHWSGRESKGPEHAQRLISEHGCWGGVPEFTASQDRDEGASSWDLELGIMAGVLDVRLGFGPARLDRPATKKRDGTEVPPPPPAETGSVAETPRGAPRLAARTGDAPPSEQDALAPR